MQKGRSRANPEMGGEESTRANPEMGGEGSSRVKPEMREREVAEQILKRE